jgi:hypothetical protein
MFSSCCLRLLTLAATSLLCNGDSLMLNAGIPFSTYFWSTGQTTQAIYVTQPGFYYVYVNNSCGFGTDFVSVALIPAPQVLLGDTLSVCLGDTLVLDAQNPGATYVWSTGETTQTLSVVPQTVFSYSVTVSNTACSSSGNVVINLLPLPNVNIGSDTVICSRDTLLLDAGNPGASFLWSDGSLLQTNEISLMNPGMVWVNVSNGNCLSSDTIFIDIIPDPIPMLGNDTIICPGTVFIPDAGNQGCSYLWSTGETTQQITISSSGLYIVEMINQCEEVNSDTILVSLFPVQSTGLGSDTVVSSDLSLLVQPLPGFLAWMWNNGSTNSWLLLDSTNLSFGENIISLQVTDSNGCTHSDSMIVTLVECQLIPIAQGWSIISTYIEPFDPSIQSVMLPVVSNVIIMKNGNGLVYWPQYNLNTILIWNTKEGYQIRMANQQVLMVTGVSVDPQNTPIDIPQGWSLLGYLRKSPGPIENMLSSIVSSVMLVKNGNGMVFWPAYFFNNIGNMNPGEGYLIKLANQVQLLYPQN